MENLKIAGTERSPEIDFNFENHTFLVKGESCPEDVSEFFGPIMGQLEEYASNASGETIQFTFELIYFNSSTAKVLMGLFDTLDEAAESGNDVTVTWVYEEDDDNMEEMGEEFGEDLEHAKFELKAVPAS